MGAPGERPESIRLSECVQCRTCVEACHPRAITFPALPSPDQGGEYLPVDVSRRGFLYSATGGLWLAFLVDRSPFATLQGKRQLIRPPGAIPEAEFMRTCVRCAECMKSCPTNTLQPCNRDLCLVWAQDKLCLICDEICPYNAIVFRTIEGYRRPVVIASRCNGCGFCEQRCPVQGESAIVVVPNGEIRLKEGSYVEAAKKLQLEFKPDPGDDRFILEKSGIKVDEGKAPGKGAIPKGSVLPKKPKGFL